MLMMFSSSHSRFVMVPQGSGLGPVPLGDIIQQVCNYADDSWLYLSNYKIKPTGPVCSSDVQQQEKRGEKF